MSSTPTRLERLIESELGECCAGDVDERLASLEQLAASAASDQLGDHVGVFGALSSETRYRLTRLLVAAEGELCVCELTPLVEVTESAVSHALGDLVAAGLATRRSDGRWHYYDATELATELLEAVDEQWPAGPGATA